MHFSFQKESLTIYGYIDKRTIVFTKCHQIFENNEFKMIFFFFCLVVLAPDPDVVPVPVLAADLDLVTPDQEVEDVDLILDLAPALILVLIRRVHVEENHVHAASLPVIARAVHAASLNEDNSFKCPTYNLEGIHLFPYLPFILFYPLLYKN